MPEWDLRSRLVVLLLAFVGLFGLAGVWALQQLGHAVATIDTVYRDRIVPVQQIRAVERAYLLASDALAQLRRGTLDAPAVQARMDDAARQVARQWAAYKTTEMVPRELELIVAAERAMQSADQAAAR